MNGNPNQGRKERAWKERDTTGTRDSRDDSKFLEGNGFFSQWSKLLEFSQDQNKANLFFSLVFSSLPKGEHHGIRCLKCCVFVVEYLYQ